jgi:hypothetical protein
MLPKAGDLLWAFAGTNAAGNPPVQVQDSAGAQWRMVADAPSAAQRLRAFLAWAPRDYDGTDAFTGTWTNNGNQRGLTVRGCAGINGAPLAVISGSAASSTAPAAGPGGRVQAPALLLGAIQNGAGGGVPSGLTFGDAQKMAWQAATGQWQTNTAVLSAAPVPALALAGTLSGSQAWAVLAFGLAVRLPLRAWDGLDWLELEATGAQVWDGTDWLVMA